MSGVCQVCGSDDLRIKRDNGGAYGMNNIPVGKGRKAAVALDSLVCVTCGHVELSIGDREVLDRIASSWDRPSA
jgi:hypothetical protein